MNLSLLVLTLGLGMRHGVDPDHLAAVDGLSCIHPSRWNGVLFAIGHGLFVTLLAVGVGGVLAKLVEPYAPWFLIAMGVFNLFRLGHPVKNCVHPSWKLPTTSPLLLGVFFGASFETASQLSALVLSAEFNPWILGAIFSSSMILVDGIDGYFAAKTQARTNSANSRSNPAARVMTVLVNGYSIGLGVAELIKVDLDRFSLPLGLSLFLALIALRIWSAKQVEAPTLMRCCEITK